MLPYILILTFVVLWIYFEKKAINHKSFWIPLILLSTFAGIRNYTVGTDSAAYTKKFRYNFNAYNFQFNENVELGYQFFEYILLQLTHNYFWLFFIFSIIVVGCFLIIIKRYSTDYVASVFLYITLGVYTFFFNGLRQAIAVAILALATPYLIKKNIIRYLIITAVASMFHISAILLIPFYFLTHSKIKFTYKILISFFTSLLGSRLVIAFFADSNPRYEQYTSSNAKAGGLVTLSVYTLLAIFLIIIGKMYKIKNSLYNSLLTYYSIGIFFIIPLTTLQTDPSGPQRLLQNFIWTLILLLPIAINAINNKYIAFLIYLVFLVYFIIITFSFNGLTPYLLNPIFKVV